MKEETKKLIKWAEEHFRQYQISIHTHPEKHSLGPLGVDQEFNYSADFLHFLKTLPDIENKLCFGGYIQDYNGTPCCHGDKVMYKSKVYTLQWSQPYNRFFLKADKSVRDIWDFGRHEILKVSEDKND